jgi:hypothetical protein
LQSTSVVVPVETAALINTPDISDDACRPGLVVMLLVPLIPETPNSLIQRGQLDAGRTALQEIRGQLYSVDNEFSGILKAAGISSTTKVRL